MESKENVSIINNIEEDEEYIELQKELVMLDEKKKEKLKLIQEGDRSEEVKKEVRELLEQQIAIMKRISVIEMIYNLAGFEKYIIFDFKNRPKETVITILVIIVITLIVVLIFYLFSFSHFFFNFVSD